MIYVSGEQKRLPCQVLQGVQKFKALLFRNVEHRVPVLAMTSCGGSAGKATLTFSLGTRWRSASRPGRLVYGEISPVLVE